MEPYTLLYPKNWRDLQYKNPRTIKIVKGENLNLFKHAEIKNKIGEEWQERKLKNKNIFSAQLYRLSDYSIKNGDLVLELGKTCYKELTGTNYLGESDKNFFNFLKKLGKKERGPYKYFSMALSVGAVIETKDGYVLIARRSEKVESCKNTFHTIAGQAEPKTFKGKMIDFSKSAAEEIESEAGLKRNEYKIYFAGLIINNLNIKPELIFIAKSKINLVDILLRQKSDAFEAKLMFGIKKDDLKRFLNSFPQKEFCPPGLAAWKIYSKIEGLNK